MKQYRRLAAALEVLLLFPAVLFLIALFVRDLQPERYEPAHTAQRIVQWFAGRLHLGLWVLLIALPLAALVFGLATLARAWSADEQLRGAAREAVAAVRAQAAMLIVAAATLTAGAVLTIVAVHVLTD